MANTYPITVSRAQWMAQNRAVLEEKLLAKRDITSNGCWSWTGAKRVDGRGFMHCRSFGKKVQMLVYRVAAWLWLSADFENSSTFVCHRCDNPICFNPEHLFLGSQTDNMQDAKSKGRLAGAALIRGEQIWTAKLTQANVLSIRARLASGDRAVDLGLEYGVSASTISNIKARRLWSHI